jgi:hypothetical protein
MTEDRLADADIVRESSRGRRHCTP